MTPGGRARRDVGYSPTDLDAMRLEFEYDGIRVPAIETETQAGAAEETKSVTRNPEAETGLLERLKNAGVRPLPEVARGRLDRVQQGDWSLGMDQDLWLRFCTGILPELKEEGWQITTKESFLYQLAQPEEWYGQASESENRGWLSFELGVQLDGQRVNLLPAIVNLLRGPDPHALLKTLRALDSTALYPVPLVDGRLLPFSPARLIGILEVLVELSGKAALDEDGRIRISKWRAGELAFLVNESDTRWFGPKEVHALGCRLRDFDGIVPRAPSLDFTGKLRPYQKEGLGWLQFLREYQLPGILADDMGLGKTVQILAHLALEKSEGRLDCPALVVAPTSLMSNWLSEAQKFAPQLKTHVSHGTDRRGNFDKLRESDLIITSYPLLHRDHQVLLGHEYHCVILDEAQAVKNPKTLAAHVCARLNARQRICVTGTPIENHLGELWSLFNILLAGFLGTEREFNDLFRVPIEKDGDASRREGLNRRIRPFVLRRKKDQVEKDLPAKTEIIQRVEFGQAQRDLYETIRVAMHQRVLNEIQMNGIDRSKIVILDALLKMRQICCDPRLLKMEAAAKVHESAKFEFLFEFLEELLKEGRKILLFSQFTSMLALIGSELDRRAVKYAKLTGQTRDRATPTADFQNGKVSLFLISLKAGGVGLNLTAADTVILYDPWWNPAIEEQAAARAHRIGQTKAIFVYKLVAAGTVEERILELQQRKKELANALFEREAIAKLHLEKADFEALFEPLK